MTFRRCIEAYFAGYSTNGKFTVSEFFEAKELLLTRYLKEFKERLKSA